MSIEKDGTRPYALTISWDDMIWDNKVSMQVPNWYIPYAYDVSSLKIMIYRDYIKARQWRINHKAGRRYWDDGINNADISNVVQHEMSHP